MTMTKTILRNALHETPTIYFENLRLVCHIIGLIDWYTIDLKKEFAIIDTVDVTLARDDSKLI